MRFPLFFFFKEKKASEVFVCLFVLWVCFCFLWWWINNTKKSLVKGEKNERAGGLWISRYLDFFVEGERRRWSLPGGPIFFQLKGKIFLCRDSILLNTFYNVMIIKNKNFGHFRAGRRNQISFNIFSLLLLVYACHCMIIWVFLCFNKTVLRHLSLN